MSEIFQTEQQINNQKQRFFLYSKTKTTISYKKRPHVKFTVEKQGRYAVFCNRIISLKYKTTFFNISQSQQSDVLKISWFFRGGVRDNLAGPGHRPSWRGVWLESHMPVRHCVVGPDWAVRSSETVTRGDLVFRYRFHSFQYLSRYSYIFNGLLHSHPFIGAPARNSRCVNRHINMFTPTVGHISVSMTRGGVLSPPIRQGVLLYDGLIRWGWGHRESPAAGNRSRGSITVRRGSQRTIFRFGICHEKTNDIQWNQTVKQIAYKNVCICGTKK